MCATCRRNYAMAVFTRARSTAHTAASCLQALTRYQIRKGLSITGQLDVDTSKALGTKPAVTTTSADSEQSSETWRRLRRGEQKTLAKTNAQETSSPGGAQSKPEVASRQSSPAASPPATTESETKPVGPTLPENATAAQASVDTSNSSSARSISTDRLRDYVGAFVLAGLDPRVGAEADFFADQVQSYDQGVMSREQIREDLKQYAARWPERRFWIAGDMVVEPQNGNRVKVTFPLRVRVAQRPERFVRQDPQNACLGTGRRRSADRRGRRTRSRLGV